MTTRTELGVHGERIAAAFLTDSGLRLLDRNWRCRDGELDIVARDGEALVFCEVKTRTATGFGHPGGSGLSSGICRSLFASSSTLTSLNVSTRTFLTNRAGRYMSQTHASLITTSK